MNTPPEQSEIETFHALLAESDVKLKSSCCCNRVISIHALLAESDNSRRKSRPKKGISIHALLAESDGSTEAGRAGDI